MADPETRDVFNDTAFFKFGDEVLEKWNGLPYGQPVLIELNKEHFDHLFTSILHLSDAVYHLRAAMQNMAKQDLTAADAEFSASLVKLYTHQNNFRRFFDGVLNSATVPNVEPNQ